ncbi:MAG: sensor domain-containing diguanylate cyclase [Deltaproteobacteria bacterium]|nr:sensor domain-containing diguanylate cyclase [Candidatus Zymogenaceae bacterium]
MEIGITITDLNGTIIYTNPVEATAHGWSVEELIGKQSRIFAPKDIWRTMTIDEIGNIAFFTRETTNVRKDGTIFPVRITSDIIRNEENEPIYIVNASMDLSEKKRLGEMLFRLSITDSLTGLFNRRYFQKKIADEMSRARRMGYPLSLIMLDVDDLKIYNDTHGHLAGDDLLLGVAEIIAGSIRKDTDTAYRYGGDEFMVILPNSDEEKAGCVALRIARKVTERFGRIGVSAGVAGFSNGDSEKGLIHAADRAMYADKGKKKRIGSVENMPRF